MKREAPDDAPADPDDRKRERINQIWRQAILEMAVAEIVEEQKNGTANR